MYWNSLTHTKKKEEQTNKQFKEMLFSSAF